MTDKELHKLKRSDLLEIVYYLQKELERLRQENEKLEKQVENMSFERELSDSDVQRIAQAVKQAMYNKNGNASQGKNKKGTRNRGR